MTDPLREGLEAEIAEPGHVTKAELRELLDLYPPPADDAEDFFDDLYFDPRYFI